MILEQEEQAILGTILVFPGGSIALVESLSSEDFADAKNKYIFEAISEIYQDGNSPSSALVASTLRHLGENWNHIQEYSARLMSLAVPLDSCHGIVLTLKDATARRKLQEICGKVSEMAASHTLAVEQAVTTLLSGIDGLTCHTGIKKPVRLNEGVSDLIQGLREDAEELSVSSGYATFDDWLGGFRRGETSVIAGRPSMGKSTLMFSLAGQAAKRGANILLFSLEMPNPSVIARIVSDLVWNRQTPIPYHKILKRKLQSFEIDRLERVNIPDSLIIDDRPGLTAVQIASRARSIADELAARGEKLDLVMVDHLGRIRASDRYAGQRVHETGEKIGAMTVLARQLSVPVVVAHQLSRQNESRQNKRPELSDLRDSGDLEQEADNVLFVYRSAYYLERISCDTFEDESKRKAALDQKLNDMEVIVAKCRNGKSGTMNMYCDMGSNVVRDKC